MLWKKNGMKYGNIIYATLFFVITFIIKLMVFKILILVFVYYRGVYGNNWKHQTSVIIKNNISLQIPDLCEFISIFKFTTLNRSIILYHIDHIKIINNKCRYTVFLVSTEFADLRYTGILKYRILVIIGISKIRQA